MNNNTNKVNNPMKVITGPDTRWSYANVWEAKSINGGTPKFSVSLIIPKSDTKTVAKVKAAIEAAYHEGESKLKGNGKSVPPMAALKTPLRDGDSERPDDEAYANSYCWFDASSWSTLSFTFSGSAQYFQLRWGVYSSTYTGILGASEVRVTRADGASGSWNGTYSINVTDLSGGYYAMLYFYSGSIYSGTINISKVILS